MYGEERERYLKGERGKVLITKRRDPKTFSKRGVRRNKPNDWFRNKCEEDAGAVTVWATFHEGQRMETCCHQT